MFRVQELGGVETHIGDLVLTSELTSSNWGDKHLFFRHQVARARCPDMCSDS